MCCSGADSSKEAYQGGPEDEDGEEGLADGRRKEDGMEDVQEDVSCGGKQTWPLPGASENPIEEMRLMDTVSSNGLTLENHADLAVQDRDFSRTAGGSNQGVARQLSEMDSDHEPDHSRRRKGKVCWPPHRYLSSTDTRHARSALRILLRPPRPDRPALEHLRPHT